MTPQPYSHTNHNHTAMQLRNDATTDTRTHTHNHAPFHVSMLGELANEVEARVPEVIGDADALDWASQMIPNAKQFVFASCLSIRSRLFSLTWKVVLMAIACFYSPWSFLIETFGARPRPWAWKRSPRCRSKQSAKLWCKLQTLFQCRYGQRGSLFDPKSHTAKIYQLVSWAQSTCLRNLGF